jgi:hypothetical protein
MKFLLERMELRLDPEDLVIHLARAFLHLGPQLLSLQGFQLAGDCLLYKGIPLARWYRCLQSSG